MSTHGARFSQLTGWLVSEFDGIQITHDRLGFFRSCDGVGEVVEAQV